MLLVPGVLGFVCPRITYTGTKTSAAIGHVQLQPKRRKTATIPDISSGTAIGVDAHFAVVGPRDGADLRALRVAPALDRAGGRPSPGAAVPAIAASARPATTARAHGAPGTIVTVRERTFVAILRHTGTNVPLGGWRRMKMLDALFPYNREVGRKEYALRLLLCLVISAPVLWWRWQVVRAQQPNEALIFIGVLIVVLAVIQTQLVGRLRDMGASPMISFVVFIPYVNLVFALALLLFPSAVPASAEPRSRAAGD